MKITSLSIALFLIASVPLDFTSVYGQQDNRGQSVKLRLPSGQQVDLYAESHALVIGVSQYRNGLKNLPGVKTDVDAVSSVLEWHGFKVTRLLNPDYRQFDESVREFIARNGRSLNARLLIYYAGHGETLQTADGRKLGYLVPADAPNPNKNPEEFLLKAMSMDQIEVYAKQIASKHVMFVFDSCFSGMIFLNRSTGVPPAIENKMVYPVRQFITAGTENQTVPDESTFRKVFVRGLEGEADLNRDGYITGSELGSHLEDQVANYTQRMQTPIYGKIRNPDLDRGDMVFDLYSKVIASINTSSDAIDQRHQSVSDTSQQIQSQSAKPPQNKRVLVLIVELSGNGATTIGRITDALARKLSEDGLTCTRSSDIDSGESAHIKQLLAKLELEGKSSAILLRFGVIVSGDVTTRSMEPYQNLYAALVVGSLKAIETATGQTIAVEDFSEVRGFGNSQEQANGNALVNAAQKASESLAPRIVQHFR